MEDSDIIKKLKKIINECVERVLENDGDLLKKSEWAITFRLGYYLQHALEIEKSILLKGYIVDSEYNRFEDEPKKAFEECGNCEIKKNCLSDVDDSKKIRPDLIIHIRGENEEDSNLMVIEVKKQKQNQDSYKNDYNKLKYLTCKRAKYRYQIGAHIVFSKRKDGKNIKWFENGKESKV